MYRAPKEAQDAIRESNRDGNHCPYLKESSTACDLLPEKAGKYAGKVCPNNPYELHREFLESYANYAELLAQAFYVEDLRRLGQLPRIEKMEPAEFTAVLMMRTHTQAKMFRVSQAVPDSE